jgi:S-adenosylmethionine decarboxylase
LNEVAEGIGRHCISDLYGCSHKKLDDESFIREALVQAAERSGATLLSLTSHKFQPQGVTALALLSESHISIHTWPELGYAAVDAFTCGTHTDPKKACEHLETTLEAKTGTETLLERVLPTPSMLYLGVGQMKGLTDLPVTTGASSSTD